MGRGFRVNGTQDLGDHLLLNSELFTLWGGEGGSGPWGPGLPGQWVRHQHPAHENRLWEHRPRGHQL